MEQEICKCEYCNRDVKNNPLSRTGHLRVCKLYKIEKNRIINSITKDYLLKEYVENEKSATAIAKELGLLKHNSVIDKLKEFNIYIRTFKEGRKAKGYIEKTKKTCNEKYGADYHTLKNSNIRNKIDEGIQTFLLPENKERQDKQKEKIRNTCIDRYGAINCLSKNTKPYKQRNKTVFDKYGVYNVFSIPSVINSCLKSKYEKDKIYTYSSKKADYLISEILKKFDDNEHVKCANKGKEFGLRVKETGRYYFYDLVDTKSKKCIEFNGNYWHANPKMYDSSFLVKKAKLTASEIWEKDRIKLDRIKKEGYTVKIVWESDFDENPELVINECIKFLN